MPTLKARAKINWTLDILGRREDGYHRMDMLMSTVELSDELALEPSDTLTLQVAGSAELSGTDNLVLKAARALQQETGCTLGASFRLTKHAPIGAGMGGGSADAAAALWGLNRLWQLGLDETALESIALRVGADVPFLLKGGFARVGGIGEAIVQLPPCATIPLVLVQPCQALSTREVFTAFDRLAHVAHPDTDAAQQALLKGDLHTLARVAGNVLQQAGEAKRPQIAEAVAALEACGAAFAQMTGSGSAVFGAFTQPSAALHAWQTLHKRWHKCWITQTATEGISEISD